MGSLPPVDTGQSQDWSSVLQPPPSVPPMNGIFDEPVEESSDLFIPTIEEQQEIVGICQQLKTVWKQHASQKKTNIQRAYAYVNNEFFDSTDLLPLPGSQGQDKDNNPSRPQIFFPATREIHKIQYSFLRLTLLPDDEDYFRIKGKDAEAAQIENDLTEAVKYLFKKYKVPQALGKFLQACQVFGLGIACPKVGFDIDANTGMTVDKWLEIENWNPLHFYIDPNSMNPRRAKWGYFGVKKLIDILDYPYYFNKDQISAQSTSTPNENDPLEPNNIRPFEGLNVTILDTDDSVYLDHYFFPYLKLERSDTEYRNVFVSVGMDQTLIEFRELDMPGSKNPVVYGTWADEVNSPYGLGPCEEVSDLQRLLNLVGNYGIETMARMGNRMAVNTEQVKLDGFYGLSGGVLGVAGDPSKAVFPFTGNLKELEVIFTAMAGWKTEMQAVAGAQAPSPQSASVLFKDKTATEAEIMQGNTISVSRETVEHLAPFLQDIIEKCIYLLAEIHTDPIAIRVEDPVKGTQFLNVDLSVFKNDKYTIELVGANPSQSKAAQSQGLMQMIQAAMQNPMGSLVAEPWTREVASLNGIKNFQSIMDEFKAKVPVWQAAQQLTQDPELQQVVGQFMAQRQAMQNAQAPQGQPGMDQSPPGQPAP